MLPEKFVLADRVLQVAPSPTLAVNAKAKALRAAGADILNFSVGEPDMSTPAHVCEAGKKAIDDGHTRYTPVAGILELREAVCAKLKKDQGWDLYFARNLLKNREVQSLLKASMVSGAVLL